MSDRFPILRIALAEAVVFNFIIPVLDCSNGLVIATTTAGRPVQIFTNTQTAWVFHSSNFYQMFCVLLDKGYLASEFIMFNNLLEPVCIILHPRQLVVCFRVNIWVHCAYLEPISETAQNLKISYNYMSKLHLHWLFLWLKFHGMVTPTYHLGEQNQEVPVL